MNTKLPRFSTEPTPFAVHGRTLLLLGLSAALLWVPVHASADSALARTRNCAACHALERKLIGPSYQTIAARYRQDPTAAIPMLIDKVRKGGVGAWGQIPMPANPQVSPEEAERLVRWILLPAVRDTPSAPR